MILFNKMTRWLVALLVVGGLFYFFGRPIWQPVWLKLRGAKSVASLVEAVQAKQLVSFDAAQWSELVLVGLKEERMLEVWGRSVEGELKLIQRFPFTGFSGGLGPKLREGDGQIPEGVYVIEYLNPNSRFHLSMKLDYPNAFDQAKGRADGRERLGFDIFIHGGSATIGCIPIGDAGIEQLFLMVSEIGRENVTALISPYDMRRESKQVEIPEIDWELELYGEIKAEFTRLFGEEKP